VYIRLSELSNAEPHIGGGTGVAEVRRGGDGAPVVLAIGPMLDPVLAATADIDVTVLYTARPQPIDGPTLRANLRSARLGVVERYLQGTTAPAILAALPGRAIELLSIGVPNVELRRYGSPRDHARAHGLDAAGIRRRLEAWLAPVAV
jgi:transketolase